MTNIHLAHIVEEVQMIQKSMDKKTAGKLVDDFIGEFGGLNP